MRGLTAVQIVNAWEEGQRLDTARRAIVMLYAAFGQDVLSLSDREVAVQLVALKAATFGPAIEALVRCATCGEALEIAVSCDEIASDPPTEFLATCEACGGTSSYPFDIRDFVWRELAAVAQVLLDEVHAIAAAYGWTEREILEMSPERRRSYLARLGEVEAAIEEPPDTAPGSRVTEPGVNHVGPATPAAMTATAEQVPTAAITPATVTGRIAAGAPLIPRLAPRWAPPIHPPAAQPSIAPTHASPPDHTVHVSIGRLDIRATPPETPRAKPTAPAREPSLGLAEYLQRREERKR